MRMCGLLGVLGSGNLWVLLSQVGMTEGGGVPHRCLHGDPEQVTDAADVAAGGVDLLQDAVFAQRLGSDTCSLPTTASGGEQPRRGALVDEQMRVDGVRPGPGAVVQPPSQTDADRAGQGDGSTAQGEPTVDECRRASAR